MTKATKHNEKVAQKALRSRATLGHTEKLGCFLWAGGIVCTFRDDAAEWLCGHCMWFSWTCSRIALSDAPTPLTYSGETWRKESNANRVSSQAEMHFQVD